MPDISALPISIPTVSAPALAALGLTELLGKTALVTGAAGTLGAALLDALAAAGADIVAADIRLAELEALVPRLAGHGVRIETMALDVADPAQARRAVEQTVERLGRLDILINNAGTDAALPLDALAEQDWQRVIGTNLNGPFLLAKHAAVQMRRQGEGDIVNVASTAPSRTLANASAYHASKWGLPGLSHALHAELRPHGIRVSTVVAGCMRTPFPPERLPERLPEPDPEQDPAVVAHAILGMLLLPRASVIPELIVLPMQP